MYKTKLWDCSNLRTDSSESLSRAGAAVEFGHNHGVADGHQEDGDEEHDDVDEEVIYLLDSMDLDDIVGVQITMCTSGEDLIAWSLHCLPCLQVL